MRLTEIWVYPIKALKGVALQSALTEPWGLQDDRRWMIVDETGRFLTQRVRPAMALICAETHAAGVTLSFAGCAEPCEVAIPAPDVPPIAVGVWRDTVAATPAGPEADRWLTANLGITCRLVYMADPVKARPVDPQFGRASDRVSFADGFPLLATSQQSLDDLNGRLRTPVPMSRFRPNLVVEGLPAWHEDEWTRLKIGDVLFDAVKPCARCAVTTVDQATGIRAEDIEPLRTLQSFRRNDRGLVLFGQNLIPRSGGTVRVGDTVAVLAWRPEPGFVALG